MTYLEFKNKYIDKSINIDGAYGAQCYDLAMAYMKEVWGIQDNLICKWSNGVRDFAEHFSEMFDTNKFDFTKNSLTNEPPQGAVFVFGNGKFGHAGIVESANQNTFVSLDQNWGNGVDGSGTGDKRIRLVTHNYQSMLGWITPKTQNNNSDMALQQDLRNAIEAVQWDEATKNTLINAVYSRNGQPDFGYILAFSGKAVRDDLANVVNQVNDLKIQLDNVKKQSNTDQLEAGEMRRQISELKDTNITLANYNKLYIDEIDQLKKEIVSKDTKISELQEQITSAVTTPEKPPVNSSNKPFWQSKKFNITALSSLCTSAIAIYQSAGIVATTDSKEIMLFKLGIAIAGVAGITLTTSRYITKQGNIDTQALIQDGIIEADKKLKKVSL